MFTVQMPKGIRVVLLTWIRGQKPGPGKDKVKLKRRLLNALLYNDWTVATLEASEMWEEKEGEEMTSIIVNLDDMKDLKVLIGEILDKDVSNGVTAFALLDLDEHLDSMLAKGLVHKDEMVEKLLTSNDLPSTNGK